MAKPMLPATLAFFILNLFMLCLGLYMAATGADMLELTGSKKLVPSEILTNKFTNKLKLNIIPGARILAAAGVFLGCWMAVAGFLGMVASLLASKLAYALFINLLVVLLFLWLFYVLATAYLTSNGKDLHEVSSFSFEFGLRFHYWGRQNTTTDFEKMANGMQVELHCCGMDNYTEYRIFALHWLNVTNNQLVVPPSCCVLLDPDVYWRNGTYILQDNNCPKKPTPTNSYIEWPCYYLMEMEITSNKKLFTFFVVCVPVITVGLIVLASVLMMCGEGIVWGCA